MALHENISEWHGKDILDADEEKIGKLEDVYVDVETDEPVFGTIKEGLLGRRHLTFVPLDGLTIGPQGLRVTTSRGRVQSAPNIALEGDTLSQEDEAALYHHFGLNYFPPENETGRRLARR